MQPDKFNRFSPRTQRKILHFTEQCLELWSTMRNHGMDKRDAYEKLGWNDARDSSFCPACHARDTIGSTLCREGCIIDWPGGFCNSGYASPWSRYLRIITMRTMGKRTNFTMSETLDDMIGLIENQVTVYKELIANNDTPEAPEVKITLRESPELQNNSPGA